MNIQRLLPHTSLHTTPHAQSEQHVLLFDTASTRAIEAQALVQVKPDEPSLMQRAGHGLFRLICACYPHAQNIWVVAGAGNNGGDALVAATWLHRADRSVHITWLGHLESSMSADTAKAVEEVQKTGLPLHPYLHLDQSNKTPPKVDLIIDGLLGIGLNTQKPLSTEVIYLINAINQSAKPVVAVDLPSGLQADTGAIHSHCARAHTTLTFLCPKPGLFTANGREYCGEVWLDTLDTSANQTQATAYLYTPQLKTPNQRAHNTHKGSFGDVAVVGGAQGMTGAPLLAARAAITAGAGRVYVSLLASDKIPELDINHPELMFKNLEELPITKSSIACGCGGGSIVSIVLPRLLEHCPQLLLDADALNAVAQSTPMQQQLQTRTHKGFATIITPHPLEAARLLKTSAQHVQGDRIKHAQALANTFACTCVLKGSGTITASPNQTPIINSSGNAALATAGSGDVLAGWLIGRWSAAALQNDDSCTLHQLVTQGVWEHGYAADKWLQTGQMGALPASQLTQWL